MRVYRTIPLSERFLAKTDQNAPAPFYRPDLGSCWRWLGFIDKAGYGRIRIGGKAGESAYAHRVSFEQFNGPIPDGLHIDHLCRNHWCVNPTHLETVTPAENVRRGVSPTWVLSASGRCARGHEFSPENTHIVTKTGQRQCRVCRRLRREREAVHGTGDRAR